MTKTPEFVIDENESKALAKALANVAEQYDGVPMSPQMMAWFGLIQAAGMVYGPRVFAYRARKAMEPKRQRNSAAQPEAPNADDMGLPGPKVVNL